MWYFIQLLIWGKVCEHKWKLYDEIPLMESGKQVGREMICICEKCGTPKNFKLI